MLLEKNSSKRATLAWYDILILTVIFWGEGIYTSTVSYIALIQGATTVDDNLTFSAADNYGALTLQTGLLLLALLYLCLRRFDFKAWNIRITPIALVLCVPYFLGGALLMDGWMMLSGLFAEQLPFPGPIAAFFGIETVSSVIYAIFNGMYEELFFLGICLSVKPTDIKWAVPVSLLIRFSFHTYQGLLSAFGIGILFGCYMYLLYRRSKDKNLVPFFLAHTIGDIIGLGVLGFFFY